MPPANTAIVVTTIREPTACMQSLAQVARAERLQWIVIGDRKGPHQFDLDPAELVSLEDQKRLSFKLAPLLPERHYARKNIGYLLAISRGSSCIYETDDDNAPTSDFRVRSPHSEGLRIKSKSAGGWLNVYRAYTSASIWPRGLPLDQIHELAQHDIEFEKEQVQQLAPIQQGLANGSPDVDAVWRLTDNRSITFVRGSTSFLPRGTWCPFNSQNIWWWKEAFPLLYLPSYCSFRMTDIWRSFVAQRCLWELGYELSFHSADVLQERNQHDLMTDFRDEIVGYLRNDEIRRLLEDLPLSAGASSLEDNILTCYRALIEAGVMSKDEILLLSAWLEDCRV